MANKSVDTVGAGSLGKAVGIIPARLSATRLPNKPLADILGKPMVQHVYERARRATLLADLFVATPDQAILDAVHAFGGKAVLTRADHQTGTDRVAEAAESLPPDVTVIVNVQGDEPLLDPQSLDDLASVLLQNPAIPMASLYCPLPPAQENEPSIVKVVCDLRGNALYFSRSPIPFPRTAQSAISYRQHLGLYAYQRETLQRIALLTQTPLERAESLEQLRVLENGISIRMVQTDTALVAVDTLGDLERVRQILQHERESMGQENKGRKNAN